jgi:hypothetical protein
MWGVDLNGSVNAKFELTYSDGSAPDVITVATNVDQGDFKMVAAGFHFSSPTVSVKLENSVSKPTELGYAVPGPNETVTPSPVAKPAVAAPPKVTLKKILCIKGKVKKEVVGTQCPKGFKKSG